MKELIILLVIVLIIFGPKKLPGLGRAIGQSIREFRDGVKDLGSAIEDEAKGKGTVASADNQSNSTPAKNEEAASDKPAES